jgi:YVTN family beta-propeller protein
LRAFTLAACLALALLAGCNDTPEPSPNYREYAYISNGGSNSVTVIDLRALAILTTVSVGRSPTGLAVNPRKNEIYVANTESNNISVIDAETNNVVATIGVHRAPFFVDVSSDGKRAYVANSGSANLSVIDLDQRKVI